LGTFGFDPPGLLPSATVAILLYPIYGVNCQVFVRPTRKGARHRKSVRVDPAPLRRAQKILRTPTESETIRDALDLVAFRRSVLNAHDRVAGKAPDFPDPWTGA
jgi:hypothetical protein